MMTEGKTMTEYIEVPAFQVKETELARTSTVGDIDARVYSTDASVRVEFGGAGHLDAGVWLTPTQANELIQLLQATFVK